MRQRHRRRRHHRDRARRLPLKLNDIHVRAPLNLSIKERESLKDA
jgi:hypothetical protein